MKIIKCPACLIEFCQNDALEAFKYCTLCLEKRGASKRVIWHYEALLLIARLMTRKGRKDPALIARMADLLVELQEIKGNAEFEFIKDVEGGAYAKAETKAQTKAQT